MTKQVKLYIPIFLISFFLMSDLYAQYEARGGEFNYIDAENFYAAENYHDALPLYELLIKESPENLSYQLKAGICYLHLHKNPEKTIDLIKRVYDKDSTLQDIQYYLGKAYALDYKFTLAIPFFEKALLVKNINASFKEEIPMLIQQCKNAPIIIKDSLSVEIINIGQPVNTAANEYGPVINADETILLYTYSGFKSIGGRLNKYNKTQINGNFNEDIYISHFKNNEWSMPVSISSNINSNLNEGVISLSNDGKKLYLYKDTRKSSGDILESIKTDSVWSKPKRLSVNSKFWEGHASVSLAGKIIIFSSDKPGGFGGKDLYSAVLQEDSSWADIKNLGPTINTKYNEDAPYFNPDGETFNFSSEGHTSMGGYDIFASKILNDSTFSIPKNIGYPINTTANDVFYRVAASGNIYYSSARRGGAGQNDIYLINVNGINIQGVVLLLKDPNSPISNIKVNIFNKDGSFNLSTITNKKGRYYFSKLPYDDYFLSIEDADDVLNGALYLFSGNVTKAARIHTGMKINDVELDAEGKYEIKVTKEEEPVKLENSANDMSSDEILNKYGKQTAPGLIYKVQVSALAHPENFEGAHLNGLGDIEQLVLEDKITRFTLGNFKTLEDATQLLSTAKDRGQDDAFIIVFVNGKRTYLEELIENGILK